MNNNPKIQIFVYSLITISFLLIIGFTVIIIDPFFHYHAPLTDQFYYSLNNARNQDDGIVKHFEYNAIVTGTSMTENFKVSEVNEIFGVNAVKVPVAGATYNEVNSIIKAALQYDGATKEETNYKIKINNNEIKVNLQTLISNGFLTGTEESGEKKKLIDPKTHEDLGSCKIKITRLNQDDKVTYKVEKADNKNICPSY